jgi:putative ABC transport system permease protein
MVASIAGITFAVLLMFMEFGFLNAMYDSHTEILRLFNADLILVNRLSYSISVNSSLSRRRLYQALSIRGVENAFPLYMENRAFRLQSPDDRRRHIIRVIAYDLHNPVLKELPAAKDRDALGMPDTALIDLKSKKFFGNPTPGIECELTKQRIRIVGTFSLGTDFINDGNLIMSADNFARLFPPLLVQGEVRKQVQAVLVQVSPDYAASQVKTNLQDSLPEDTAVYTKSEIIEKEKLFWKASTSVGYVFWLATLMGFSVGVVVCYQILYTGVVDHLPQFGTLKAMGFKDSYLIGSVLRQAFMLAALGFVPGLLGSLVLYRWIEILTGLPMRLAAARVLLVLVLTVAMCVLSGIIAVRRAITADPAEVFQ